ncbi:MAG TPA: FeoA family protein [Candidatus Omnitrophota bacterium]|nr:FeoA family protein [Candidatus Omnitrophota bacterium]HRY85475.1 FeoA family protein [Candidatus Omnitrophota bacterium]
MPTLTPVTLDQLLPGESGVILGYAKAQALHHRLKELGLVEGTRIKVKRCAPLGDPMEFVIRGYHLSIRKEDARCVLIQKDEDADYSCGRRHRHRSGS